VGTLLGPAGQLKAGNAMMNVGFALSSVGGAALAGLLLAQFGLATALLVDAASFLAIAVLIAATRDLPRVEVEREPWRERLNAGLRFVRGQPAIRLLLTGEAIALVLFTIIVPIEVVYAKQTLGASNAGFGILLASWGAGIVIGSLVYLAVKARSSVGLIAVSTAAVGLAYLGMASASTLAVACGFSVLGGIGNGVQWIVVMTALQEATPRDYQARVTGLLESLGAAMPGIGYVLGGVLASLGSPRTAYAVAGVGVLLLVGAALAGRSRIAGAHWQQRPVNGRHEPHGVGSIPLPDPLSPAPTNGHDR
jgi:MFS family permease